MKIEYTTAWRIAALAILLAILATPAPRVSAAEISLQAGRSPRAGAGWRNCDTTAGVETCRSVIIITAARSWESAGAGSMEQSGRDIVCVTHQVLKRLVGSDEGLIDEFDELGCGVLPLGTVKFDGLSGATLPITRVALDDGCHWTPETGCQLVPGRDVIIAAKWQADTRPVPSRPMHWGYSDSGCVFSDSSVQQQRQPVDTCTIEGSDLPVDGLWGPPYRRARSRGWSTATDRVRGGRRAVSELEVVLWEGG